VSKKPVILNISPEVVHAVQDRRWAAYTPDQIAQLVQARLEEGGVPRRFRSTRLDDPETVPPNDDLLNAARRYVEGHFTLDGRPGLLFIGSPGTGKTSTGVAVLRAFLEVHQGRYPVRFWNVPQGLVALMSEFHKEDERQATTIPELAHAPLLLLDDLGKHKMTRWVEDQFYALIDRLWSEEKNVLITSNLAEEEFMKLDPAIISRIMGLCHLVRVQGTDLRLPEERIAL
jgi:DNA replication protein DnaC